MKINKIWQWVQRQTGFTLVELLIAMTILAIGLLSMEQILAVSTQNAAFGRTQTAAVSLAREIEEKVLCTDFNSVQTCFNNVDTAHPGTVTAPCQAWAGHLAAQLPRGRGRIWVRTSAQDPSLLAGMLSVQVQVSWKGRGGDTLSVPLKFAMTTVKE